MTWHPEIPGEYRNAVVCGDARTLSQRLPDESIDLVFTDPVYDQIEDYYWLGRLAARVLKPDRGALVFFGIGHLDHTLQALKAGGLTYRWQLILYYSNRVRRLHVDAGWSNYTACLWMDKGRMKARKGVDLLSVPVFERRDNALGNRINHQWSKPSRFFEFWLERFTQPGEVVLDPFTGGGTVPAVCRRMGRQFVAFEQNAENADLARERVRVAPQPLPGIEPISQAVMAMETP